MSASTRETSKAMAALAAKVLGSYSPTDIEIMALAGCVLSQADPRAAPAARKKRT